MKFIGTIRSCVRSGFNSASFVPRAKVRHSPVAEIPHAKAIQGRIPVQLREDQICTPRCWSR